MTAEKTAGGDVVGVSYDEKFRGLIVEVSREALDRQARSACAARGEEGLLIREIGHVTYVLPTDPKKKSKRALSWLSAAVFLTGAWVVLSALGLWKLVELAAQIF